MSTFNGRLKEEEFSFVAIDYFRNLSGVKCYFLSHCHRDHMTGIEDPSFHYQIYKGHAKLYCSSITKKFLEKDEEIKIPAEKIVILQKYGNLIELEDGIFFRVTYLPAGHCPGSIMLLFEGFGLRILYTGDFRMTLKDLQKLKPLHMPGGEILPLDSMYFDSTFADSKFETFPSREDSLKTIKEISDNWLKSKMENKVMISSPAGIGFEFMMKDLAKHLHLKKIHVSDLGYKKFLSTMEELDFLTTEPEEARVHFCYVGYCSPCFSTMYSKSQLLKIKPTALIFTMEYQALNGLQFYDSFTGTVRVAYSSHCSFKEMRQFIHYLRPKKIYPCVVPSLMTEAQMEKNILEAINADGKESKVQEDISRRSPEPNLQQVVKKICLRSPSKIKDYSEDVKVLGLESPPR